MLRYLRITFAAIFFALVLLLFLDFTGVLYPLFSWVTKMQLVPAVLSLNVIILAILLVLTLLFGRVYCSIICPMGIFQDIVSNLRGRVKKNRFTYSKEKKVLRLVVLAVFIIALILGVSAIYTLIEPYSAFGRIATNLLAPVYQWGNNLLASWSESAGNYDFYRTDILLKSGLSLSLAIVTMLVIGYLAYRSGRTYCNTFCPVGTFLGYISKFSLLKVRINESKCISCGLCTKNCKASCIDFKNKQIDYSRCVACMDCIGKCKKGALSFGLKPKADPKPDPADGDDKPQADATRKVVASLLAVAASSAVAKAQYAITTTEDIAEGGLADILDRKAPPRSACPVPPGSESFKHLTQHCTACQLCITKCPNNVLKPSMSLDHFLQPVMDFTDGYCRPECNICSQVCPNGAIKPIDAAEKTGIHVGQAIWIRENCLPIKDGVPCGNCERQCPNDAITMTYLNDEEKRKDQEYQERLRNLPPAGQWGPAPSIQAPAILKIPVVNTEKCIGCGACENLCPSRPNGAIYVDGLQVHRTGK